MPDTTHGSAPERPTAQHVVQTHRPVLRRIVQALREGTTHARWYFDEMDEEIDKALAPALVRKGAKRYLKATGTEEVHDEDAEQVMPEGAVSAVPPAGQAEFLSNLGLAVSAEGIRFRVLRSDDGAVPVPGPSKARQAFYSQQAYFPEWNEMLAEALGATEPPPSDVTNCVLHWETDEEYNLRQVYLALPLTGAKTRESVTLQWNEIIWRRHAPEVSGAQVEAETIDQDIYIQESTGTGG